jgi:hypothetical protein
VLERLRSVRWGWWVVAAVVVISLLYLLAAESLSPGEGRELPTPFLGLRAD